MKKITAALLVLLLLAGCAAPVAESPQPAAAPVPSPTATPTSAPDLGNLTQEEVERVNAAFSISELPPDFGKVDLEANGFFTSYYADVRELEFAEFLCYYPTDGSPGEEEFAALVELPGFPWGKEYFTKNGLPQIPQSLPVPTHRILRSSVDETLQKYAGITTTELKNTDGVLYLPEYDAYYIFTSDFGPGSFTCVGGRVTEDTAVLWSEERDIHGNRDVLTLQKEGESWYIQSFLLAAIPQSG